MTAFDLARFPFLVVLLAVVVILAKWSAHGGSDAEQMP